MYSIGIDVGSKTLKMIVLNEKLETVYRKKSANRGNLKANIRHNIVYMLGELGINDFKEIKYGAVTGSGTKLLSDVFQKNIVNEVSSLIEGSLSSGFHFGSIIEIGCQGSKFITGIDRKNMSNISISMNSDCAAGTGSFLEEQVARLNMDVDRYTECVSKAESVPAIAGRCSVFAKTDIIHHQQEGVPVDDILLGVSYAVAKNYKGAVIKRLPVIKPILFVGGVAENPAVLNAFKDILNAEDEDIIIPDDYVYVSAKGAALIAARDNTAINIENFYKSIGTLETEKQNSLPKLKDYGKNDSINKHRKNLNNINSSEKYDCYLGVDVGSTSTNLVLIDNSKNVLDFQYLRTNGDPINTVINGLKELHRNIKDKKIKIRGVGVTGSGRYLIGDMLGADVIKDEISSQAEAALFIDRSVDTIFEIGGQDSKYIKISHGKIQDFKMNKVCAAGTGSFIEEQAKKLGLELHKFSELALESDSPVDLGERCTVFIETSLTSYISNGENIKNITAGLCFSIVRNYLNRVVGNRPVGDNIFLQGGIAYNQGIINAFRALTGKDIRIPEYFSVTGAYGAAIFAQKAKTETTMFKGFKHKFDRDFRNKYLTKMKKIKNDNAMGNRIGEVIFKDHLPKKDKSKKTIGIPRALFTFGLFPMFNAFFKDLGFNVVLSESSTRETVKKGQEYSLDETCFPVKLIMGHIAELVDKKVDYIFFPDLYTADHSESNSRKSFGCVYMQVAFKIVEYAMDLNKKNIELLSPTMAFNKGKSFMVNSFLKMGEKLGKNETEVMAALNKAFSAAVTFRDNIEDQGREIIKKINPENKVFVIISKMYGVVDPVLNAGIPDMIRKLDYQVISFSDLLSEEEKVDGHPNMYWSFGQHILSAADYVKKHNNFYAVYLTHHGCGPDSIISHYVKETMGSKPWLNIEIDEHSSGVGIVTRIEAFINSLEGSAMNDDSMEMTGKTIITNISDIKDNSELVISNIPPYSYFFKAFLEKSGYSCKLLEETNSKSITIGKEFTETNEYLSLAAVTGDIMTEAEKDREKFQTFLVPQNEGAETDGQHSRFIRNKLDEHSLINKEIFSPFIEDMLKLDNEKFKDICLMLIAGDICNLLPEQEKKDFISEIHESILKNRLNINIINEKAQSVDRHYTGSDRKKVLITGEIPVMFQRSLNNNLLSKINKNAHGICTPLSEAIWLKLSDFAYHDNILNDKSVSDKLNMFSNLLESVSNAMKDLTIFEKDVKDISKAADSAIGFYSGAAGRYRTAKILLSQEKYSGIISLASMYENTGIIINMVSRIISKGTTPFLNLNFDGHENENEAKKLESFLYYLKEL